MSGLLFFCGNPNFGLKCKLEPVNTEQAYDRWSGDYDTVINKTRDLEAVAFRAALSENSYSNALEIGCGTGKNTVWLMEHSENVTAVDFSPEMLARAKAKIESEHVRFALMDVRHEWPFPKENFDLISVSLMLEHIENIGFVFQQAHKVLKTNGVFYLGELHPFKQYQGSKARFETGDSTFLLECFVHHVSDFFQSAVQNGFEAVDLKEWFDDGDRSVVPRILAMKFRKKQPLRSRSEC